MALNIAQLLDVPGGPGVIGAVQAGTGISITADGTISATGDLSGFNPGDTIVFGQAAAPAGWTKVTTYDNYALRIVSGTGGGTGGTNPFTTAFTSFTPGGNVTVTNLQISGLTLQGAAVGVSQFGSHGHNYKEPNPSGQGAVSGGGFIVPQGSRNTTGYAGGNGQHSHSVSGTASASGGSGTFTGTTTTQFAVRYYDVILCRKN